VVAATAKPETSRVAYSIARFWRAAREREVKTVSEAAASIVLRAPKRAKSTPTTGLENPMVIAKAAAPLEICVMLQPNSAWKEAMKTGKT
jgi:hypothetical protein